MKKLIILLLCCAFFSVTNAQTFNCISENINPNGSSNPEQLTLFTGWFGADDSIARIWFVAEHSTAGKELCVTRGAWNNTRLDKDEANTLDPQIEIVSRTRYGILYNTPGANLGLKHRQPSSLGSNYGFCTSAAYNGSQFAFGNWEDNNANIGRELYKLSGGGLIKDINPGANSSDPDNLTAVASDVYFSANNGSVGNELWVTNGSAGTTLMVKDINLGSGSSNPHNLTRVQNSIFFEASTPQHGSELWVSDGTSAGTHLVKDITLGSSGTLIQAITSFKGKAYFNADDGINGRELWVSDGTDTGTYMLKDLNASGGGANPQGLASIDNQYLCFSAVDPNDGREFYVTDGTAAGTRRVKNINQFPNAGSSPAGFTAYHGKVYFYAFTGTNAGRELYESDLTAAGTQVIHPPIQTTNDPCKDSKQMIAFKGKLIFTANYDTRGNELWTLETPTPVATSDIELINSVNVYPNPTTGFLQLETKQKVNSITITDMSGKQLIQFKVLSNQIDISQLSSGIYFIQIETDKGLLTKKILKAD